MNVIFWSIAVILGIMVCLFLIAFVMSNRIVKPKVLNETQIRQRELSRKRLDEAFYDSIEKTQVWIESSYGYRLSAMVLDNAVTKKIEYINRIAVICHGNKQGKLSSVVYAKTLMKVGFTCIIYDHRNHGSSDKFATTMGYYEKYDLKTVVDWCYENYGAASRILTFGESMGAATVLSELEMDERIALTISDCAYSDLRQLEKHIIEHYFHLPAFLFLPFAGVILKWRGKFDDRKVRPMDGALTSKTPILFIHGDCDMYVPTQMSIQMYEQRKGPKEIYLAKGAEHALSCVIDRKTYEKTVLNFIQKYYR